MKKLHSYVQTCQLDGHNFHCQHPLHWYVAGWISKHALVVGWHETSTVLHDFLAPGVHVRDPVYDSAMHIAAHYTITDHQSSSPPEDTNESMIQTNKTKQTIISWYLQQWCDMAARAIVRLLTNGVTSEHLCCKSSQAEWWYLLSRALKQLEESM